MDRQLYRYINPVQPLAAPVMICFANQGISTGPSAKAGGASGSRAHPTFSARPAGQSRFAYTSGILYPPLSAIDNGFGIPGGILGF